jgi:hypothetical protein
MTHTTKSGDYTVDPNAHKILYNSFVDDVPFKQYLSSVVSGQFWLWGDPKCTGLIIRLLRVTD